MLQYHYQKLDLHVLCENMTCMMMAPAQSTLAPEEVPKSGPLGSHFFAAKAPDVIVKYVLLTFAKCNLSPVDHQTSRTLQLL